MKVNRNNPQRDTAYFTMHSAADDFGRRLFTVDWFDTLTEPYGWAHRLYHTTPDPWIKVYGALGLKVEVLEEVAKS